MHKILILSRPLNISFSFKKPEAISILALSSSLYVF